jgi:hypothetical protein
MSQAAKAVKAEAIPHQPIVKHVAPPYVGMGFSTFKSGPAPQNFWSAIAHDVTRGGLVVQLGGNVNLPPGTNRYAAAYAGYQYEFKAPATPPDYSSYVFRAKFNTGPVSIRNIGGNFVSTFCEILLVGGVAKSQQMVSNTPATLYTDYELVPNTTYKVQVRCGVSILQFSPANAPYGEVIIKDIDLETTRFYNGDSALPGKNAQAALSTVEDVFESVGSIEEAQAKGLIGTF